MNSIFKYLVFREEAKSALAGFHPAPLNVSCQINISFSCICPVFDDLIVVYVFDRKAIVFQKPGKT